MLAARLQGSTMSKVGNHGLPTCLYTPFFSLMVIVSKRFTSHAEINYRVAESSDPLKTLEMLAMNVVANEVL